MINSVPVSVTFLHGALLAAMIAALAFEEKLHAKKSVITGAAAVLALLLGAVTHVLPESHGHMPFYIAFIDWGVIAIMFGSSLFVGIAAKSGIFSWLAIRLTKLTGGDPFRLLCVYSVMTVLFSALLNNVTAMVIVGSLTVVSLTQLGRKDLMLGFLLCEGLLTNIGGLLTLISSVPNIIIGHAAGITFMKFVLISTPYVVVTTAITIFMARMLFRIKSLESEEEREEAARLISTFDENDGIESRLFFFFAWGAFIAFILTLATTSVLPYISELGIGFVAVAFGILLLLRERSRADQAYATIDWDLLLFFIFLFVVIGVAEHAGVLGAIGAGVVKLMGLGETGGPLALLWSAALASSVTDNIPLAAVLAKTMAGISDPAPLASTSNYWWAVIYGSNLGGNLTPIGSASTLVAVAIIHKQNLRLNFISFVIKALPFAAAHLVLASLYVYLLGL